MARFVIPPQEGAADRTIFLAGPVQGTHDWQSDAAAILLDELFYQDIDVVSPRGQEALYRRPSVWLSTEQQTPWEKRHLVRAKDHGCLAMWFAAQEFETPGRVFAQTSRIELGRIAGWMDYDKDIQFAIGIDPRYVGGNETYIRQLAEEHHLLVASSLDEWCEAIVEKLN